MYKTDKKVLFITSSMTLGGIERVLCTITDNLVDDYNITILCLEKAKPFYKVNNKISILYVSKYFDVFYKAYRYIHNGFKKYFGIKLKPNLFIKSLCANFHFSTYDIIIFLPYSFFMFPKLIEECTSSKNIMWMHNNYKVYFEDYYKYMPRELKEAIGHCDCIVSLTNEDKQGFGAYSDKVITINNPVTIDNKGFISNLQSKIISITCRFSIMHKGLDYLVQISKKIPANWKIAVAGTGSRDEIRDFKKLIKEANVESKFILRGALEGKELIDHYMNSSIYVMTSRWEGFGLVLTEAMSFGLPVISFENSGSKEILQDGKVGILIEQGDIVEFSNKLNLLIDNFCLREELSKKSLTRVKSFKREVIIGQWRGIL